MRNIPFNVPPYYGNEGQYVLQAIASHKICGDGQFTEKCTSWISERFDCQKTLLTCSGTAALEMAALLCEINPDDEVIMPSYTFSSTANAFVLAGAKLVFCDIRPDTMNIDETLIETAITERTKVICVVHYAGVVCEMDTIMEIAKKHQLYVVEDAAQAMMSKYKGRAAAAIGDFGCFSFHETKNYSMGEGGALLIRREINNEKAEIMREKGTNRSQFRRGEIDKYSWVDWGSSYLPSELNAAYLWSQLEAADEININRRRSYYRYQELLTPLAADGLIRLPFVPKECEHNSHIFYIRTRTHNEQTELLKLFKAKSIGAVFHYVPLHSSKAGQRFGRFHGVDRYTTNESDKLIRLPMYYALSEDDILRVVEVVFQFFSERS